MCHFAGEKFASSHTTAIEAAVEIIKAANANALVSKIVLAKINQASNVAENLKISPINAGLKLTAIGKTSVQEIYVYTTNPQQVEEALRQVWNSKGKQPKPPKPWNPKMKDGWNKKPWSKWKKQNRKK